MTDISSSLNGGFYTLNEAARLLKIDRVQTLRNWITGKDPIMKFLPFVMPV